MFDDLDEHELWEKYPHHHNWWNKLYVAEKFGYQCGPGGTPVPESKEYIVRPTYNLAGMGLGAEVKFLEKGDRATVLPGYFWCEYLRGKHYSASYIWKTDHMIGGSWESLHCWEGINFPINITKFIKWKRSSYVPKVPRELNKLYDAQVINIEYINDNPIEVHLRASGNPDGTIESQWNEYIPIWDDWTENLKQHYEMMGYKFIPNPFDNWMENKPHMKEKRLGYYVR